MTITLTLTLPADFFGDILETALESSDWIKTRHAKYDGEDLLSIEARPHWQEGKPFPDGDARNDWQTVTRWHIERGMQKALEPGVVGEFLQANIIQALISADAGRLDCSEADAILQVAMFGELVFG